MGRPFSLRCLSPLCSPAVGGGQTYPLRGGTLRRGLGIFAAQMNRLIFFFPQSAWGRLTPCGLGCFGVVGRFCGVNKRADFLCPVGGGQAYPLQGEMFQCSSYIFATQKAGGISNPRWPLLQAMRPVAEWRSILCNWQEAAPDRRAVAPVVPRR